MTTNPLDERLRAIEDEFFYEVDLKLWEELRENRMRDEKRQQLNKLMHVEDQAMLDELIEQGIDDESVAVLLFVPLAFIAWADGRVTDAERKTVIEIVTQYAPENSETFVTAVKKWLVRKPDEKLWDAWQAYVHVLREQSPRCVADMITDKLFDYARRVAEVSHSFLSFNRINPEKQQALDRLENALKER
jgi:hypothetical protein